MASSTNHQPPFEIRSGTQLNHSRWNTPLLLNQQEGNRHKAPHHVLSNQLARPAARH